MFDGWSLRSCLELGEVNRTLECLGWVNSLLGSVSILAVLLGWENSLSCGVNKHEGLLDQVDSLPDSLNGLGNLLDLVNTFLGCVNGFENTFLPVRPPFGVFVSHPYVVGSFYRMSFCIVRHFLPSLDKLIDFVTG